MARASLRLYPAAVVVIRSVIVIRALMAMSLAASPMPVPSTAVPAPGKSPRIDAIRHSGVLRVAVLDEYPWLKQNKAGNPQPFSGPAWRLAEEYARRLDARIFTTTVTFQTKVSAVTSGAVDITIAPLLVTPERERQVDIIPYSVSAQCLLGLASNPKVAAARSIDDLNRPDITIAYMNGSPQGEWLKQRLPKAARQPVAGALADVPIDAIRARQSDVTNIDKYFFAGYAHTHPGLVSIPKGTACLDSRELPIPIGMAVAKGQPELLAWLRAVAASVQPAVEGAELDVRKKPF